MKNPDKQPAVFDLINSELSKYASILGSPINEEEVLVKRKKIEDYVTYNPYSFFVEVDLKSQNLVWSSNVSYFFPIKESGEDQGIRLEHLIFAIHPAYVELYLQFGLAVYRVLIEMEGSLSNAQAYHYHLNFPMNRLMGTNREEYWWVKQSSRVSLVDEELNMISHINEYRFIEKYNGQVFNKPLVTYIYDRNELHEMLQERLVNAVPTREVLEHIFDFTDREIEIMRLLEAGHTSTEVAKNLGISQTTVSKHNSNIVSKAKQFFPQGFLKAKNVAVYFKQLLGDI